MSTAPRILTISYDFAGSAIHDRALMEQKIARDRYSAGTQFCFIVWSQARETAALSPHITIESLPSLLGHFRPIYDVLSIIIAPLLAYRRHERPDMIVVADFPLLWAAAATRLLVGGKVVMRLTNLPSDLARSHGGMLHRAYYRVHELLTWGFADEYIAINETTRTYLAALGVSPEKISVIIPNVIARDEQYRRQARPGAIRARYSIPDSVPIAISVARLESEKGFDTLLTLWASLPFDARLIIIGDGSLRVRLEEEVRNLQLENRVLFAGLQDRTAIWNYYADADAFVLLSHSEALGLVFWEAMFVQVPVIGRPVGGITETIGEDGLRGFFWDAEDGPDAFAEKLMRCFKKGESVRAMIARAEKYARERSENSGI